MNRDGKALLKRLGLGIGLVVGMLGASPVVAQETKEPPAPAPATDVASLPKGEEILDRYVKETGGKEAYEKITSMVLTGQLELMMNMKGAMKVFVVRPSKMYSEVEIPNMGMMRSGSDGTTVWSDNPIQGPRILEGEEREMTMEGSRISEEANWRDRYTKVETVGTSDVKGKPAYKVELTDKGGKKRTAFYDKASGLLVKQEMVMQSELGEMPMVIEVSDYKKVGELLIPHKSTTSVMGQQMSTTFEKIEVNVDVPADKFALPKEIKELKDQTEKKDAPASEPEKK